MSDSVDPDQTLHAVASDLSLQFAQACSSLSAQIRYINRLDQSLVTMTAFVNDVNIKINLLL